MGFSRLEYWSGLPFPSPGDLPNPGIKPRAIALRPDSLPSEPPGKPIYRPVLISHWMWVVLGQGKVAWPWVSVSLQAKAPLENTGSWDLSANTIPSTGHSDLDSWKGIWMVPHRIWYTLTEVLMEGQFFRNAFFLSCYGIFSTNPISSTYTINS